MALSDPGDFTAYKVDEKLRRVIDQGAASSYVIAKTPLDAAPELRPFHPAERPPVTENGDVGVLDGTDWVNPGTGEVIGTTVEPAAVPETERTSWWPRDLAGLLAGDLEEEPAPSHLARTDGHRLFYAGKVNALIGESESGKTWVGLLAVAQALAVGQPVLYLDFEDTLAGITGRLRALGVTDAHLQHLTYISPDEDLDLPQKRDLDRGAPSAPADARAVRRRQRRHDAARARPGEEQGRHRVLAAAAAAAQAHRRLPRHHRPRHQEQGQPRQLRHRRAGQARRHRRLRPHGRGRPAVRPRHDRPAAPDGQQGPPRPRPRHQRRGEARRHRRPRSATDGSVQARVEAPDLRPAEERGPFRPTVLMERVSRYLEQVAGRQRRRQSTAIEKAVTGNNETPRGRAGPCGRGPRRRRRHARGARLHRLVKPYEQALDPMADQPRPPALTPP